MGAATGFAVGLLVDLLLLQTLGVTSLIFTLIGYWSGRLRELRDPQAALTPLLVGAAAAAASLVGYSLMEFLLGVDAPVSLELLRQIVLGVRVDTVVALPVWALVRRCLERRPARRSPPAPAPACLHDRRSEPALALVSAITSTPTRAGSAERAARLPRVSRSWPCAWRCSAALALAMFAIIFFRLWYLQVLTGEQYVQQANANRVRDLPIPAPRGQILDREGQPIVASRVTNAVQIVPSALPPAGPAAAGAVPAARARCSALSAAARARRW